MLPTQDEKFYEMYLYNHFRIRSIALWQFLSNPDAYASLFQHVEDISKDQIVNSLKLEIRGTYFQAIETLFELLFALECDGMDLNIWKKLTSGGFHYEQIDNIANEHNSLLDTKVEWNEGAERVKMPFVQYAFYLHGKESENAIMEKNLEFIKRFLILIAKDFSNRLDYNAYKHGLRLFPTMLGFHLQGGGIGMGFDLSNSYTLLDKNDEYKHIIINYDPARDLRMIVTCGELIHNLVALRRAMFLNQTDVNVFRYDKEEFFQFTASEQSVKKMTFSIKPIE